MTTPSTARLDAWRAELAETQTYVNAAEPRSPEHQVFLSYLRDLAHRLEKAYDAGDAESPRAEIFRQALRAFLPLLDRDWLRLQPVRVVKLDDDDRDLLASVQAQRPLYESYETSDDTQMELITLMAMTLEAIEIYILMHYVEGKEACIGLMEAIAGLFGYRAEA